MIFNKKNKNETKCEICRHVSNGKQNYCANCGNSFLDSKSEKENFGMLGRNDFSGAELDNSTQPQGFGITDKLINSIFNSMMKSLDKQFQGQFKELDKNFDKTEIKSYPNGIRIKISGHTPNKQNTKVPKKIPTHTIGSDQIKKMNSLPREKAKTNVKRIGDKIIYELATHGLESPQDVFVSKLESGYEIKAIGAKKVYVNSIPINLPMTRYSILKNKLLVEFNAQGK